MLVLSRKSGQSVLIGNDIEVYVDRINGDQVRLAVKAPRAVLVLRNEILKRNEANDERDGAGI